MSGKFIDLDTGSVRTVSDREFFVRLFGTDEQRAERDRQMLEQCIKAIERGNTYGWPPVMVDRAKEIMALRDAHVSGDPLLRKDAA